MRARAGHARRVARLDPGAVWRPTARRLTCATAWHAAGARAAVATLTNATRDPDLAPGQGIPGRVGRSAAVPDVARAPGEALRAGLITAIAFPLAVGDECFGVIEFFASGVRERNGEVSAMFATVGGQLAQYLARRRRRARARRGFLDGAEALIVVLDSDGRVQFANARACAVLGRRGRAARPRVGAGGDRAASRG